MIAPYLRRVRGLTRPPVVHLNRRHPLAAGLVAWWPYDVLQGANAGGGTPPFRELVKRYTLQASNGLFDGLYGQYGPCAFHANASSAINPTFSNFPTIGAADDWSYDTRFYNLATSAGALLYDSTHDILLERSGAATNNKVNWRFSSTDHVFATQLFSNTWWHIAVVRRSGVVSVWANGVKDATTVSDSTASFAFNQMLNAGGFEPWRGYVEYQRFWWKRALTGAEVQQLAVDPYILAVPAPFFAPGPPSAGGFVRPRGVVIGQGVYS